jgi:hypothetical protein
MKTYTGIRTAEGTMVRVRKRGDDGSDYTINLDPRLDVRRYGLAGFDWGRIEGGGCTQLALALLCDALDSGGDPGSGERLALDHVFAFEEATVEHLLDEWTLTQDEVLQTLARVIDEKAEKAAQVRKMQVETERKRQADEQRDKLAVQRRMRPARTGGESMTITSADVGKFDVSDIDKNGAG